MNRRHGWLSGIGPIVVLLPVMVALATLQVGIDAGFTTLLFVAIPVVFVAFILYNASRYLRGEQ